MPTELGTIPANIRPIDHVGPRLLETDLGIKLKTNQRLIEVDFDVALILATQNPNLASRIGLEVDIIPRINDRHWGYTHPRKLVFVPELEDGSAVFMAPNLSDAEKAVLSIMGATYQVIHEINPDIHEFRLKTEIPNLPEDDELKQSHYSLLTGGLSPWSIVEIQNNTLGLDLEQKHKRHLDKIAANYLEALQRFTEGGPAERIKNSIMQPSIYGHILVEEIIRRVREKEKMNNEEAFRYLLNNKPGANVFEQYEEAVADTAAQMIRNSIGFLES